MACTAEKTMSSHSLSFKLLKFHLNTFETLLTYLFLKSQFLFVCVSVVHVPPPLSSTKMEQSGVRHEQWVIQYIVLCVHHGDTVNRYMSGCEHL